MLKAGMTESFMRIASGIMIKRGYSVDGDVLNLLIDAVSILDTRLNSTPVLIHPPFPQRHGPHMANVRVCCHLNRHTKTGIVFEVRPCNVKQCR